MDWTIFQEKLVDYVRLELSGETAEIIYPEIAYFIESLPQCEAAYYDEFQRQGQQTSVEVLRQINSLDNIDELHGLEQLSFFLQTNEETDNFSHEVKPNWYEIAIAHGKAWLDEETNRWEQVLVTLSTGFAERDNRMALAGLMSDTASTEPETRELLQITEDEADIEIIVFVRPDVTTSEDHSELEIAVARKSHFGDFSGIQITLLQDNDRRQAITDTLGKVYFNNIKNDALFSQVTPLQLLIAISNS